ncbi:Charged multivesicular body protein 2A [Orobanche gracilis]
MCFPSGKRKIPAELRHENKRMLDKSIRELGRVREGLKKQRTKLTDEIKMTAKQGQMRAVTMMAQDLIKTRNHMIDLCNLKSELYGLSYTIQ